MISKQELKEKEIKILEMVGTFCSENLDEDYLQLCEKLRYYDPEFSTKKMADDNPFNNFVMVDGFIHPVNSLPEDLQKMVKEARANGGDIQFHSKQE